MTAQRVIEDRRSRTTGDREQPICVYCNKEFGRSQELKRHVKDVHMPRRRCPFCPFVWARPGKIKAHLVADHAERFTAEILEGIKALCGRRVIEFVDAYDHIPDVDATLPLAIPLPVSKCFRVPVAPRTLNTPDDIPKPHNAHATVLCDDIDVAATRPYFSRASLQPPTLPLTVLPNRIVCLCIISFCYLDPRLP